MPTITQHRPAFIDDCTVKLVVSFATVEQLLAIPFVVQFRTVPSFHRFSLWMSDDAAHLMAEYRDGLRWFVVGRIDGEVPILPTWTPVYPAEETIDADLGGA